MTYAEFALTYKDLFVIYAKNSKGDFYFIKDVNIEEKQIIIYHSVRGEKDSIVHNIRYLLANVQDKSWILEEKWKI